MRKNLEKLNYSENKQEIKEKEREISIVIIDDHKNFPYALAENIKIHFSDQKFFIQTFHEYSSEVAEFVIHHGIDIVLLDVNLKGKWSSGEMVAQDLKTQGFTNKIIFLTAGTLDKTTAKHYGADDWIEKNRSEQMQAKLKIIFDQIE